MLGNLLPSHAPSLLSHVLAGCPPSSHVWQHWRGRYGLSEEEQAAVWGNVEAYSRKDNSDYRPSVPETKSDRGLSNLKESTKEVQLVFKTWEGEVKHVTAKSGETLLEVARREGLPSMEGVCGGNLGEWTEQHRVAPIYRLTISDEGSSLTLRMRHMPCLPHFSTYCSTTSGRAIRGGR